MCHLLNGVSVRRRKWPLYDMADDYRVLAAAAGLGTYELRDPWQEPEGGGYSETEYL